MVLFEFWIDYSAKVHHICFELSRPVQLRSSTYATTCKRKLNLALQVGSACSLSAREEEDESRGSSTTESGMVGGDADADARGDCQFPSVRKTFWRSASWSSRSAPPSPGPVKYGNVQPPGQPPADRTTATAAFRGPAIPLTPRSQQSCKGRSSLPPLQPLSITRRSLEEWPKAGSDDIGEWPNPTTPGSKRDAGKLRNGPDMRLDLGSVQRNTEPTELQLKRDKFAFFDKECSRVAEHIYLGSDAVARNREILRENGITHVLNCVGFVCPEYFKNDLVYKTLWLQDSPCEDITSILYDVFDYFEEVRDQCGRVLVHCCQGVSRSTSLVIAYLMWRKGQSFEDAFQYVKAARGITNPNMGFACQLLQCQKRVHAAPMSPSSVLRMYRMAPHSPYDPLHLVPKTLNNPGADALDSRGAFIVHIPSAIYVWIGQSCESAMARVAKAAALQVVRYERAQGPIVTIQEGHETHEFWDSLSKAPLLLEDSEKLVKGTGDQEILEGWRFGKDQVEAALKLGAGNKRVESYDIDFELFRRAVVGGVVPPFSSSGAGAGAEAETHLPARENGWGILRRKFVSGSVKELVTASKATGNIAFPEPEVQKETEIAKQDEQLLSPGPLTSSLSPCLSSGFLLSDSSASLKSPSPSPSSLSFTPSPSSSAWSPFSSSQSPSPVSNLPESIIRSDCPPQTIAKSVILSSKVSPLSLAERRRSISPSLQLPALVDDSVVVSRGLLRESLIASALTLQNDGKKDSRDLEFQFDEQCCGSSHERQEQSLENNYSVLNKNIQFGVQHSVRQQFCSPSLQDSLWKSAASCEENTISNPDMADASESDESVCSGRLKESSSHKCMCPTLYEWPKIEKIDMFDADDLDSRAVFILLAPSKGHEDGEWTKVVYLWVGCDSAVGKDRIQVDSGEGRSETKEVDWEQVGRDFLEQMDLQRDIPIRVVRDKEEPDEFWNNFING